MANKTIIRQSTAPKEPTGAPTIDPEVVDQFAKLADPRPDTTPKPTMEEFFLERYKLKVEDFNTDMKLIQKYMDEYVKVMAIGNNPTDTQMAEQAGRLHFVFIRALRSVDVMPTFDLVLWYFSFYQDTVFRSSLAFRGMSQFKFSKVEDYRFATHMVTVAQAICDFKTRNQRIREQDFKSTVTMISTAFEKQRAGLTTFLRYYTTF